MHPSIVDAWVQDVVILRASADQTLFDDLWTPETLDLFAEAEMSREGKQKFPGAGEQDFDPEATPTQAQRSATTYSDTVDVFGSPQPRNTSNNFVGALHSGAPLSLPRLPLPPPQARPPSPNRRTPSPSKRYRKTSDLLNLDRPVRFLKTTDMRGALLPDIHRLYDALVKVEYNEEIFPAELKNDPALNFDPPRPYMWRKADKSVLPDVALARAQELNRQMQRIIAKSAECANWKKSESAWNAMVHYPLLDLFSSSRPEVQVELIDAAQIAPAFRPTFNQPPDDTSSQSTISSLSSAVSSIRRHGNSIHKMVDFAFVLIPDPKLQANIDEYTRTSITPTINQTTYFSLKSRPAPVFIETKTSSGKLEEANVQLGVWVAAWHESMRALLQSNGRDERIITVPLIQVVDGVWTIMFALDAGEEIHILDRDFRIGSSTTTLGIYQLQAAIETISTWVEKEFRLWIEGVFS